MSEIEIDNTERQLILEKFTAYNLTLYDKIRNRYIVMVLTKDEALRIAEFIVSSCDD